MRDMSDEAALSLIAGKKGWVISDGKAGNDAQSLGVAEALDLDYEIKPVFPRGIWKLLAPYGPVDPTESFGETGSQFAQPWPDVAIATGRLTTPYIRALKKAAGPRTFTVILLDPKTGTRTADFFWVPEHDKLRGPNVMTTLTAPHRFSPERLAELRAQMPDEIARLPQPRVAVLLGGPNGKYDYTQATAARLATVIQSLRDLGAGIMMTASRRTPAEVTAAVSAALPSAGAYFWQGEGANPYPYFLAHADAFIVPADSVNMTGEPCATGRPVYVFEPEGGSPKFERFHEALRRHGATKPCPDRFERLEDWSYTPLNSAKVIAAEIARRWAARRGGTSGIFSLGGAMGIHERSRLPQCDGESSAIVRSAADVPWQG